MLDIEHLLQFAEKYENELLEIDNEINALQQKRVVALAKVEVARDFIALEKSFQSNDQEEIETYETVEENLATVDETY